MAAVPPPADQPLATRDDIRRLERLIDEMKRQQDVPFTRIGQLQAHIDLIRGAWSKVERRRLRKGSPRFTFGAKSNMDGLDAVGIEDESTQACPLPPHACNVASSAMFDGNVC